MDLDMDVDATRSQLSWAYDRMRHVDEEREALAALIQGLESWLNFITKGVPEEEVPDAPLFDADESEQMTIRDAIREVLRQAQGAPISSQEIALRIRKMRVRMKAENPVATVDAAAHQLMRRGEPVERVGPRTWRWIVEVVIAPNGGEGTVDPDDLPF